MKPIKIAIIGAGPKAAAIAARAACLNAVRKNDLRVTIFEKHHPGANWTGRYGYTDGDQRLCTPAERDVGFPYSAGYDARIAHMLQAHFSWQSYLVETSAYAGWVNKGRLKPSHRKFADYIKHCIETSKAQVVRGEVRKLLDKKSHWNIEFNDAEHNSVSQKRGFDAVVITGTGPASQRFPAVKDRRFLNGVSFWKSLKAIPELVKDKDDQIVIVGSGGTAAAIAGWLTRMHIDRSIFILGSQASMFARVDNSFENELFTDTTLWQSLSNDDRRKFTERLNRGAVWTNVLEELSRSDNVRYVAGSAIEVAEDDSNKDVLRVSYRRSVDSLLTTAESINYLRASLVINTTGFNDLWFKSLLQPDLQLEIKNSDDVQDRLSDSLAFPFSNAPPLHLPMLSQVRSPAFTSLMALGAMADSILTDYAL